MIETEKKFSHTCAASSESEPLEGDLLSESGSEIPSEGCHFSALDRRSSPTPIFLISFNRGMMLRRVIASIRALSRPTEIIIHDNGSTDPHTLLTLDELENTGVRVFRCAPIKSADELNRVDETIQLFFAQRSAPTRYVVSDCDVDMSVADCQVLDVYDDLLDRFPNVECVGPMLRIRDIPTSYPLFNHVMNRHIEQFWSREPTIHLLPLGEVAFLEAPIDTTFAVHRAGEPFHRLKKAIRVYEPFEALHLDWYVTESRDDPYFTSSDSAISHWNNQFEFADKRDVALRYPEFRAIKKSSTGRLEVYRVDVASLCQ